jgi:copper transport protein
MDLHHSLDGDFTPMDGKELVLVLRNRAAGIEAIERAARRAGDGEWHVADLVLPVPGRWEIKLDILVSDFEKLSLEGSIELEP